MAMRAYILVEAAVGKAKPVGQGLQSLSLPDTNVLSVDVVTGPYDLIVQVDAEDLDKLGQAISRMQRVDGVQRTTTCLVVRLS
jgi:DNA-binding Lrp family transcriptional regulator